MNDLNNENHNNQKFFKKEILSKVIVLTLFISMAVGSSFGFLTSLAITKNLKEEIAKEIISGDFAKEAQNNIAKIQEQSGQSLNESEKNVTQVVQTANQSVVSVIITKNVPVDSFFSNPFDEFFGIPSPEQGQPNIEKREIGGGTGFVVSRDGFIITNKHVVSDTEAEYTVLTNDERLFRAQVLDRDPVNDIAVLKIDPKNPQKGEPTEFCECLSLGDSDNLQVGQTVIAIGNSLGEFRNTVSKGIISGLKRSVVAGSDFGQTENLSQLIQTDAAINQGNSGGPLLNLRGEVVGVNVAVAVGAENIGFAIPINTIKPLVNSVKETGTIIRPFIGIRYLINNSLIAEQNNLPYDYGALIQRGVSMQELAVIPGSPADKAGLKENDLILEINSQKIDENFTPSNVISQKKSGDKITLKVWSKGEVKDLELVLEERK